ncbi:MAG: hypothetical protein IJV41_05240 [Oscillospiraceae bacterium]|nr:hypothetical protein [Oscillospiraceae bacterium]
MIRKMLYRTEREGGGYTVSQIRPEDGVRYKVRWRLIADEGKAITDGSTTVMVIDLLHRKDCEAWQDCELPDELKPLSPEDILARTEVATEDNEPVPMQPAAL